MGEKTVDFVSKAYELSLQNPELVPPFLNVEEFGRDVQAVTLLRQLYWPVEQVSDALSDTIMLAGSEAYGSGLIFYSSSKNAAKARIQNAEVVYNELASRFPGRPRKSNQENSEPIT